MARQYVAFVRDPRTGQRYAVVYGVAAGHDVDQFVQQFIHGGQYHLRYDGPRSES